MDIFQFCEICIIFVYCFGSFAQYVDMYVDNYVDNVSILLYVLLYYYINTKICSYSPDPKQNIRSVSVKWEKTELFILGVLKTRTSVLFSGQPISYFIHIQT